MLWTRALAFVIRNSSSTSFSSSSSDSSVANEELMHCIQTARKQSALVQDYDTPYDEKSPLETEPRRVRMQEQQERNSYRSDYGLQPFPMVDRLENLEYCGSFLDMEACLRAQVARFRQEQQQQHQPHLVGSPSYKPWPSMEKITLSNGSVYRGARVTTERQAQQAHKILKQLRPDIDIICRTSFHPHLINTRPSTVALYNRAI